MKRTIIIGSGIGGLVAGNLLAKKGHKVTIFESHSSPGGYTAGFYRKGFYFESGTLSFEASASVFKAMQDIGVRDKVNFIKFKTRWVSEDFDAIPESYDEFKQMLFSAFASEKNQLERYFAEVDRMYDAMACWVGKPIPLLCSGLSFAAALITYLFRGMKYMRVHKQYVDITAGEFAAGFFDRQSKAYRLLTNMGYPDMAASFVGGMMVTLFDDYWTVYDGMQSWANVLADNLKMLGGELILNSRVDKILTKDGTAVGVSSKNVDYDADYVIAACDYKKTFLKLLDNVSLVPPEQRQKIEAASVSEGTFTVYLGLRISNDELKAHMKIPHVTYCDYKPVSETPDTDDRDFFQNASFGLYSPSMMNPKLAPQGKSSLMIQAICPTGWMQNWGAGSKEKYNQLKASVKDTLINRAETVVPNLSNLIEFEDAATPLTYERYTHNTNGASSAWSWNPHRKFFKNTMSVNVETPVQNLYIGSCWAMQIGGVPGALMAAYQCSKKI
jgi:phytoene dehydrogenase-like protein